MKKFNDSKLKTIDFSQDEILSKASLSAITGGEFDCTCTTNKGSYYLGTADTALECAKRCADHINKESRD